MTDAEPSDTAPDTAATAPDAGAPEVPETHVVTRSNRDPEVVRADLGRWLTARLGADAAPTIVDFQVPEANGMSSETVLFDAEWTGGGERSAHRLVMRLAPPEDAFPVFPTYDLTKQFETIRLIAQHTSVPVPEVLWDEPSSEPLGAPFFVMRRVDGIVPPDVMPYTFGSWMTESTDEQLDRMTRSMVDVLAGIGSIPDAPATFGLLEQPGAPGDSPLRRHVADTRRWMEWSLGGDESPLLERCFGWLEEHWPENEPSAVVSWGDSRIGNVMFDDYRPVAVLDWEMAALGPREIDLAWMIFLHRFFDDLAVQFGLPGMPDFMRRDRVEELYAEATGYTPTDMDWYLLYAATRHGIVFTRTSRRAVHFDGEVMPDDPDDVIMHRATIEAMLDGTYWESRR